jgi:hypothetical protein
MIVFHPLTLGLHSILIVLFVSLLSSSALASTNSSQANESHKKEAVNNAWLTERFQDQHRELIPIVAVADIFFSCNKERKVDVVEYTLGDLVTKMDRDVLAEKLILCLKEDTMQSDIALNFGLFGCFHQQLAHLSAAERQQKMILVKKAISNLSHEERKKSFTQCVTEQAIHYLK